MEFDALRGILALSVVLFHFTTFYAFSANPQTPPLFFFPWHPFRVQMFGILSGFVIMMVAGKTRSPVDFLVSRFSRLYPGYAVTVFITSVLANLFYSPPSSLSCSKILIHLAFLQYWYGTYDILFGAYWFLLPETAFYIFIAVMILINGLKDVEIFGWFGLLLSLVNWYIAGAWPAVFPRLLTCTGILPFWHLFFSGILLYKIWSEGHHWKRHAGLAACFLVQQIISDDIGVAWGLMISMGVMHLIMSGRFSWIKLDILTFLGSISYSLFLVHQGLGFMVIKYLDLWKAPSWVLLIVPVLISIAAATLLNRCVERPAQRWIKEQYGRMKSFISTKYKVKTTV